MAPRALKEPVTCSDSSLKTAWPARPGASRGPGRTSGVSRTCSRIRSRAARMSSRPSRSYSPPAADAFPTPVILAFR